MLPERESFFVNEVLLSSSSSSPISDPHSQVDRNNNQIKNQVVIDIIKVHLLCDESFSQINKEEEEEFICDASSKEFAISDTFSCIDIVVVLKKRKRTHFEEEEEKEADGNAIKTTCNTNKFSRINENERQEGHKGNNED